VADIISQTRSSSRALLDRLAGAEPVRRICGRNLSKADVLFYELEGRRIAVKTYAPRGILIRATLGRWLISREAAAYEAAAGAEGLPAYLGRPQAYSLATEWVNAEPLRARSGERLDDRVFDRLAAVLDELHGRGVAVADLHHRDVLVAIDGGVWVIDLATAWVLGPRPGPLRRHVFARLCESDRVNLARMWARFTDGDEAAATASVSPAAAAWHRRGRRLKNAFDRLRGKHRR
jgi:hypothetical protein